MLRFDKDAFDMSKLCDVLNTVIQNHPALLTTLHFNEDGDIVQKYTPEVFEKVKLEKISDWSTLVNSNNEKH